MWRRAASSVDIRRMWLKCLERFINLIHMYFVDLKKSFGLVMLCGKCFGEIGSWPHY